MDYLLTCDCGRKHTVSRKQADQLIECSCGQSLRVPTLRGLAKLPPATEGADSPPGDTAASTISKNGENPWSGWRGPCMAAACGGLIVSLAFASWYLLQRVSIDTSYTTEMEIAEGNKIFDLYTPEDMSLVWHSFESLGIGAKEPPLFIRWNRYAEDRALRASIAGGIAAACGIAAAGIWLSSRRRV